MPPTTGDRRGWFRVLHPRPAARLRIYLLPHAGGGPAFFRDWPAAFPDDIELVAVQAPGREARLIEPPFLEIEPLADTLAREISAHADRPFALFGHSLGALVALETIRRLKAKKPVALVISGARSPGHADSRPSLNSLSNENLRAELIRLGGTPEAVLLNDEFFELMLPTLRADLTMFEAYRDPGGPKLDVPVLALGGQTDERATLTELIDWDSVSTGAFACRTFPGGHFYLSSQRKLVAAAVVDWLAKPVQKIGELGGQIVDLWLMHLDQPTLLPDFLPVTEHLRANRYLRERDRSRFIAARSMLRAILARYLNISPAAIRFELGSHGKPMIAAKQNSGLSFNVSHSGDLALLAITRDDVGVDVEEIRPEVHVRELTARFYASAEQAHINSLPESEQREAFFAIWAGKEAYCKALGVGLHLPTDGYAVIPSRSVPWMVDDPALPPAERPRIYPLHVHHGFAAALGVAASVESIAVRRFTSEVLPK